MDLKFIPSIRSKTVKYNVLDKVLQENSFIKYTKKHDELFLYIDLHYIIRSMMNDNVLKDLTTDYLKSNPLEIFEGIIGFIGHYRNYFVTRHNLPTSIILYYSEDICQYKSKIVEDYYDEYYNKIFNSFNLEDNLFINTIKKNIELTKVFLEYVPNTTLLDTTGIVDLHAIPSIFNTEDSLNLVITNLTSQYSLINTYNESTVFIMTPSFGDNCFILGRDNFIDTIAKKYKLPLDDNPEWLEFKPHMLSYALILVGDKKLSKKIGLNRVGMVTALKRISDLYSKKLLASEYISIDTLCEGLGLSEEQSSTVRRTAEVVNNSIFVNKYLTEDIKFLLEKQIVNRSALGQIEDINNRKFDNRINLQFLMAGEEW